MTIKQANITVNVKEMETAISFYQSIGLTVKNRWGNYYAQLTAPGSQPDFIQLTIYI
jgi:catechol-2,3-dioxygenase